MASLWGELKRRNVVRVAIAYAIVAWLLIEVSATTFPILALPVWAVTLVTVLLLIGFPVALIFAWAYEITPEGLKKEKEVDRTESITHITGRKLDFVIIGVLVVAVGFLLIDKLHLADGDTAGDEIVATERQSIAVIPFFNMSDDNDNFSDGLTEEILNVLAKNRDLNVAGRTSSFAFKDKTPSAQEVGEALNVDHYLEGSVRRSGDTLRVTAQLIKVEDGFHVWSESYDRQMADIFEIQDDVARQISQQLNLRLAPEADRYTDNIDAYAIYVEALGMLNEGTYPPEIIRKLDQALAIDPAFAKAHELKALIYWRGSGWAWDMEQARGLIYASAVSALELDSTLSGARTFTKTAAPDDWSWSIEFDAIEEALKESPEDADLLAVYCYDLRMTGYYEEAVQCGHRMTAIEPLSAFAFWELGASYAASGRRIEARESWTRQEELSGDGAGLWDIAFDYIVAGEHELAIEIFDRTEITRDAWAPADIRELIDKIVNRGESGKAYLDEWIADVVNGTNDFDQKNGAYLWYLGFGFLDDYFDVIEKLATESKTAWNNADQLEIRGTQYRNSGYVVHPRYIEYGKRWGLTDLWETRGKPDMCDKVDGPWVCE